MKKNKISFIIILLILYGYTFFGRFFGTYSYIIIVGLFNIPITYFLLKINPFGKMGLFLIIFPLIISSFPIIFVLFEPVFLPGLLGYIIYLVTFIFSLLIYYQKINKKIIISIYYIFFYVVAYSYSNINNFYQYNFESNKNIGKLMPEFNLIDNQKNKIKIDYHNKIQVVDLWANSCGVCINAFPKFEKLKNYYNNDPDILFYALSIYKEEKDILLSEKYLRNYTFKNYYIDQTIFTKLNFSAVPHYMVIGKDNKIKYFGSLNIEEKETYNNIYQIINNEK